MQIIWQDDTNGIRLDFLEQQTTCELNYTMVSNLILIIWIHCFQEPALLLFVGFQGNFTTDFQSVVLHRFVSNFNKLKFLILNIFVACVYMWKILVLWMFSRIQFYPLLRTGSRFFYLYIFCFCIERISRLHAQKRAESALCLIETS